jgi:hypothetical protein
MSNDARPKWEEKPNEGVGGLKQKDLDAAWRVVLECISDARKVLSGEEGLDSEISSKAYFDRLMGASRQVEDTVHELGMFHMWLQSEVLQEKKKKRVPVKVTLFNPADTSRRIELDAFADINHSGTQVTEELVKALGLPIVWEGRKAELAPGVPEKDVVGVDLEVEGRVGPAAVYVGDENVVGLHDLEIRGLGLDPIAGKLVQVPPKY